MVQSFNNTDIKNALEAYAESEPNSAQGLLELAEICRKDTEALADPELLKTVLDITKDKTPMIMSRVGAFIKGHVRASQNLRKTGRDLVISITNMQENTYFTGKSPIEMVSSGNAEITEAQNLALHILGPAFLEDNEYDTFERLGKEWDEANKISFAEEIGIADEHLFSLGRWFTGLAVNCENTLSKQHAKIIVENVQRINDIMGEHHYYCVRIPEFLFERAELEKPSEEMMLSL